MDSEADLILDVVSRQLPDAGIDCLMIGGHAVNHYGFLKLCARIRELSHA